MTFSSFSFAMNIQQNQSYTNTSSSFALSSGSSSFSLAAASSSSSSNSLASLFSSVNSFDGLIGNPYDLGLSTYQPTSSIDNMFSLPNTQNTNNNFQSSFNFPPAQGNQWNQGNQCNQAQNPMQMMMQFMMMIMQMIMQMMGMNPQQMDQMNNLFNGMTGNNGTSGINGTRGSNGSSGVGASNNSGYVGPSNRSNAPVNSQGLASPISGGRVSSEFGMRTHPISGQRKMHTGIDIAAPKGTSVNSMKDGTVIFAGKKGGYGNMIIVDHGNGVTTRYAHLSSINVKKGESVDAGQQIGGVGSTGNSTGNHLHFEVRENGNPVNPRNYINP